jgi:hypothetical protein
MKPVPDPREWNRLRIDPETKTLIREGIPSIVNPLDKHALEAALQIKDAFGVEVVLVLYVADYLFQEVLERDQAHHVAGTILHHGDMGMALLELPQELFKFPPVAAMAKCPMGALIAGKRLSLFSNPHLDRKSVV